MFLRGIGRLLTVLAFCGVRKSSLSLLVKAAVSVYVHTFLSICVGLSISLPLLPFFCTSVCVSLSITHALVFSHFLQSCSPSLSFFLWLSVSHWHVFPTMMFT